MAAILDRIRPLIVEQLGVDGYQITPKTNFVDDLNADSLDLVELIMAIEKEFDQDVEGGLEITDEDAEKITTVQEAVDYLKDQGIRGE